MSTHTNHTTTQTSAKVVAGSLLGGIASAIALVAGPFAGGSEATITGAILIGFAIGWALLAQLSTRFGDGSHRWAAVPATALGLSGAALVILTPNSQTLDTLGGSGRRCWLRSSSGWRLRLAACRRQPALVAAVSGVRVHGALCRRLQLRDGREQRTRRRRSGRGRPTRRRRRTPPEHPLHRLGQPDGRARAGPRRVGLGHRASGSRPTSPAPHACACTTAPDTVAATSPPTRMRRATSTSCSSARTCRGRTSWPGTRSAACSS